MIFRLVIVFLIFHLSIAAQNKNTHAPKTAPASNKNQKNSEPQFPGGFDSLKAFIRRHLKYPQVAIDNDVKGMVVVKAVVWEDGHLGNFEVIQSVSKELDAEAIRIMQAMPKWIPAVENGKKVAKVMKLPMQFSF